MKRVLMILVISLMTIVSVAAKQKHKTPIVQLLESYEDTKGIKYIRIGGLMLDFAKPSIKKTPAAALVNNLEGLNISLTDEKFPQSRDSFLNDAGKVLNTSYTKLNESEENGAIMSIYIDKDAGETFTELVMLIHDEKGVVMMVFAGEFNKEALKDMARLAKEENKQ